MLQFHPNHSRKLRPQRSRKAGRARRRIPRILIKENKELFDRQQLWIQRKSAVSRYDGQVVATCLRDEQAVEQNTIFCEVRHLPQKP